jgi:hypothetical protein
VSSGQRVYVPSTLGRLRAVVTADGLGPAPFVAHAVTAEVREELSGAGDDELEYVASAVAASSSLSLLTDHDLPRRVVIALDVPSARSVGGADPTLVEVDDVVPMRLVAAVLVDSVDAEADVSAARTGLAEGAPDVDRLVDRCLDHELGWWATQEIGVLLDETVC